MLRTWAHGHISDEILDVEGYERFRKDRVSSCMVISEWSPVYEKKKWGLLMLISRQLYKNVCHCKAKVNNVNGDYVVERFGTRNQPLTI